LDGDEPAVSEHYFQPHRRAVLIREPGKTLASIDTYILLQELPEDAECLDGEGASVCYKNIGRCTAVIVVAREPHRIELVNYRLEIDDNPGKDRIARIAEECDRRAREVLRVVDG